MTTKKTTKTRTKKTPAPLLTPEGATTLAGFVPPDSALPPEAKPAPFVSMSVSLPADLAARVRALQGGLVPGIELGLSEAMRFAVQLGLRAHDTGHTLRDFDELDA